MSVISPVRTFFSLQLKHFASFILYLFQYMSNKYETFFKS